MDDQVPLELFCSGVQPRELSESADVAKDCSALAVDHAGGEADQDWCEGRDPLKVCCLPDGRGCRPACVVCCDLGADPAVRCATAAPFMRMTVMNVREPDDSRGAERRAAQNPAGIPVLETSGGKLRRPAAIATDLVRIGSAGVAASRLVA